MTAIYGFADASGAGFGSTIMSSTGMHCQYGLWRDNLTGTSSNYRKLFNLTEVAEAHISTLRFQHLKNLVNTVAAEAAASPLQGGKLFLFTDNIVAESAFYKGLSSNPCFFDLVLCLKQLELEHGFSLQVIHISGWRMKIQGTDGLSQGDLLTGVM
jgi:hypothetical protein